MSTVYQELVTSQGQLTSEHYQNLGAMTGDFAIKGYFLTNQSVTWDSTASGAADIQDITVTGVALGDIVLGVSVDEDVVDATITGDVTAANTVSLVCNNGGGTLFNPGATNVRVLIADVT